MKNINLIDRAIEQTITDALTVFPSVTITGPRQSGKTTLCRKLYPGIPYVNFEDVNVLQNAKDDIAAFLSRFPDGAIFDEVQNFPELLSSLQVIIDEDRFNSSGRKFLLTGSSDFTLMESVSQSMAGRTAVFRLMPLSIAELGEKAVISPTDTLILNGGYPAVWHAPQLRHITVASYYGTYVERDIKRIVNVKDMIAFHRFIRLCAGRIGTEFNASALSNEVGVSVPTVQNWLSVLAASYILYLLPPYFANVNKRLVKSPKLYFYDTALASYLLGIESETILSTHPLRGALFENMVINEVMKSRFNAGRDMAMYFYRDRSQYEVDLVCDGNHGVELYEIKSSKSYNSDFFKSLRYLSRLMPSQVVRTAVVYDGVETRDTVIDGLVNYREWTTRAHS